MKAITRSKGGQRSRARRFLVGIVTPLLALSLASCGIGGGGGSPNRAGSCELSEDVVSGKELTGTPSGEITLQTTALKASFSGYFEKMIAAFQEKYPEVKVNWQDDPGDATFTQRLVTDAQSCKLPDVLNLNQNTAYALYRENFLLNLSKAAPSIGDEFIPSVWESLVMPGSEDHYVLPWYWGLGGLQTFNKTLMEKAGLDPDNPPKTTLEQFEMASQIAKNSNGQFYAFAANPFMRVPSDWQRMNVKIMDEGETAFTFADDPKAQEWLKKYAELYAEGALPRDGLSSDVDITQLYSGGDVVWGSTNASFLRYVEETNKATYEVTGVAPLLDEAGHAVMEGQLIAVPSTSKNPVAALALASFLLSPEWQTEFISDPRISNFPSTSESMGIPKLTNITGDTPLDQANRLSVELAANAKNVFIYNWSDAVHQAVVAELQLAISGQKDPVQALQDAQTKSNDILKNQQG